MSITQLKTAFESGTGLQISETELQKRLDLLLIAAITNISGAGGGSTVGTERVAYTFAVNNSIRVILPGCVGLSIAITGANPALIDNASIPSGAAIEYPIPSGDTLGTLTLDATGTSAIVVEVR